MKNPSHISNLGNKRTLWLFLLLQISIICIVFWRFITLQDLYLFVDIGSDTINYSYPNLVLIARYLREYGIPFWSFSQGIGQNIFPFSLGEPFNWPLYIMGENFLHLGIIFIEICKIIIGGLIFFQFLKLIKINGVPRIIGAISFSFSSYMILGGSWYQFSTEAVYAALLLWTYEKYLQENKWYLLILPFALIAGQQPFNLYFYGLFIAGYAIFRTHKKFSYPKLLTHLISLTFYSLLGAGLAGIFLIPNLDQYWHSSRVSGSASMMNYLSNLPIFEVVGRIELMTFISRLFSNDLLQPGTAFSGWENYLEAPMVYSGLINLVFAPQILSDRNFRSRFLISFILFSIPLCFPYFRHAIWLFSGDYYRTYSFMYSLLLIIASTISVQNLLHRKILNLRKLTVTIIILLGLLILIHNYSEINVLFPILILSFFFILLYSIIAFSFKQFLNYQWIFLLLIFFVLEVMILTNITVNSRIPISCDQFRNRIDYRDNSVDVINELKANDPSFYRIAKYYSSSPTLAGLNDAKVQNFYGFSSYHSFNHRSYIRFLKKAKFIPEYDPAPSIWIYGPYSSPYLLSLLGQKYRLTLKNFEKNLASYSRKIFEIGNINVYFNPYYVPIGATYDQWINESELDGKRTFEIEAGLIKYCVIDDSDSANFNIFTKKSSPLFEDNYQLNDFTTDIGLLKKDTLTISLFSPNRIEGNILLEKPKILFFSIPFDDGWTLLVDNIEYPFYRINFGFIGTPLRQGFHTIEIKYFPPHFKIGIALSIIALLIFIPLLLREYFRRKSHDESILHGK